MLTCLVPASAAKATPMRPYFLGFASFVFLAVAATRSAYGDSVDFQRDVRPLLSRHCFKCHGPDDKVRKAKLRLDVREAATKEGRSGKPAVAPGKPDESELVRRIFAA